MAPSSSSRMPDEDSTDETVHVIDVNDSGSFFEDNASDGETETMPDGTAKGGGRKLDSSWAYFSDFSDCHKNFSTPC